MADVAAFAPDEARMILQTCKQVKSSGILAPGHIERLFRKLPRFTGGESGGSAMIAWTPTGGIPAATLSSGVLTLGSELCRPSIFNSNVVTPDNAADRIRVYNTVTTAIGAGPVQCKLGTIKEGTSTRAIWVVDVEICTPSGDLQPPILPNSDLWDEDDLTLGL